MNNLSADTKDALTRDLPAATHCREALLAGLALYGVDGTTVRVPDSEENREHFGGQRGRDESTSGYPLVRAVTLMALRSHILAGI